MRRPSFRWAAFLAAMAPALLAPTARADEVTDCWMASAQRKREILQCASERREASFTVKPR